MEGRMKSLYYVAIVTRAYRKALDAMEGKSGSEDWRAYRDELFNVSHREYSTGFFFDDGDIANPTDISYVRDYLLIGTVGEELEKDKHALSLKNKIEQGDEIEYIGPDVVSIEDAAFSLEDEEGNTIEAANHHQKVAIRTDKPIQTGFIIRKKLN